jgi:surfactin synthase thioesterase subunit
MMALTLPALRADMEMYETYRCNPGPPLACPITALYGDRDATTNDETIVGWREYTAAAFAAFALPGGHFFPFDAGAKTDMVGRLSHA